MNKETGARWAGRMLRLLPLVFGLVAMYYLIFALSAQDGETSGSLSARVAALLVPEDAPFFDTAVTIARKLAHATEYALLYLLWYPALRMACPCLAKKRALLLALGITVLSAAGDEIHQLFVPGRAGLLTDVLIDTAGALLAMGLVLLTARALEKKR